ncbi:MAG: serine/threonine protein kinase [Polyangiaceae bacterium]|nr:serine/threonine protein kinase [Polyangiaceae bacterium]MCE7894471.1 serine/threonine protein kinase [Sorangiineae bacterium PRO1]MCL4753130.1 serine/threonine protein kinase [Myxococcales bacterium]
MTTAPPPNLEGTVVGGRYTVERVIGQGGMGSVWLGRHVSLGHPVAIKFVHPKLAKSSEARRRFEVEAKAAARINSRHAVKVHDHGVTEDGHPYIVMEYLEGEPLERAIKTRGPLLLPEVTTIVTQVARALEAAHEAGVVHRDLKPDNIFLARDPEAGRLGYTVKVVDFGIAKLAHDEHKVEGGTQAGALLGTPHYMSPEALTSSHPVGPPSDVWSLGACAFSALCGSPPFGGDVIGEVVLKVCSAPMPVPSKVNSNVPREFDTWFMRACARVPAQRFQSAREAAVALQQLSQWAQESREQVSYAVRPTQPSTLELELEEMQPQGGRGKVLAGVLVGLALAIGGLGLYTAHVTRQANLAVTETAASAAAVVDDVNKKKLEEADKAFWDAQAPEDAAPAPSASAEKKPPKKK